MWDHQSAVSVYFFDQSMCPGKPHRPSYSVVMYASGKYFFYYHLYQVNSGPELDRFTCLSVLSQMNIILSLVEPCVTLRHHRTYRISRSVLLYSVRSCENSVRKSLEPVVWNQWAVFVVEDASTWCRDTILNIILILILIPFFITFNVFLINKFYLQTF